MNDFSELTIRMAVLDDAKDLLSIYTPYVENTCITFEYVAPTVSEFKERIRAISLSYPYLVARVNQEAAGYAYASTFKGRAAYDWSVEVSVYLNPKYQHQGIGTRLYATLEQLLSLQNVCNVCACITYPGDGSIQFHEAMGYKNVAHFTASGYKFNAWHDMVWMEKFLNPHKVPPDPFIPINQLPSNVLSPFLN